MLLLRSILLYISSVGDLVTSVIATCSNDSAAVEVVARSFDDIKDDDSGHSSLYVRIDYICIGNDGQQVSDNLQVLLWPRNSLIMSENIFVQCQLNLQAMLPLAKPSRLEGMRHCYLLPKCALGKLIVHWMMWLFWDIILCHGISYTASCCSHGVVQARVIAWCSCASVKFQNQPYKLVWPIPD